VSPITRKPNETGLGSYPTVTLAAARETALEYARLVRQSVDPVRHKRDQRCQTAVDGLTVKMALERYRKDFAGDAGAQTTATTIERHGRALLPLNLAQVKPTDVKAALAGVYAAYPKTAVRALAAVSRLMNYAIAHEWRDGDPAARATFRHLWKAPPPVEHYRSMPPAEVPAFFRSLLECGTMSALATAFVIATASRSGETIGATWVEIDLEQRLWVVPASRMKARREWRQPLSSAALDVLDRARAKGSDWGHVFKGRAKGKLSSRALEGALHRGFLVPYSCHGFRSTFSSWAHESTDYPHELIELSLAHVEGHGNAVARAYNRSDAVQRRRSLMEEWGSFVASGQAAAAIWPTQAAAE
jgi:integrase